MTAAREVMGSSYMHWAKTCSVAKYNLATSGLGNVKLSELRVSLDDLEITEGGYGYPPLVQSIATRYRVAPDEVVTAADYVRKPSRDGGVDQAGRRSVI